MSSGTVSPSHLFEDLWKQLRECHRSALQELEAKVNKLKADRCLDAQKLELFYNRNKQLKEQNTTLENAVSQLEERLLTGECDKCASLKENYKYSQDQSQQIIIKLENERNALEDKNRELFTELQKMKTQCSDSFSEQEDGIIPDSPVLTSSLTMGSKLRKHKNIDKKKNIRFTEKPLPWSNRSLFNDPDCSTKKHGEAEVLVVNTCQEDAPPISNDRVEEVIAETCAFEPLAKQPVKVETTTSQLKKHNSHLNSSASCRTAAPIQSPDSTTEKMPSRPAASKRSLQAGNSTAKQKKQESDAEHIQEAMDTEKENKHKQPELINNGAVFGSDQSFRRKSLIDEVEPGPTRTSSQNPPETCGSPAFKKPYGKFQRAKRPLQENLSTSKDADMRPLVEPVWSVDPAFALSMYDSEKRDEEEEQADTDCTWVSHSVLQGRREASQGGGKGVSSQGLGEKAYDSLEMMFDRTVDEEYKSFIGESQPCHDDDDDDDDDADEEMEEKDHGEPHPPDKSGTPTFPHIAVVRKKDERRKLKGTTCKECEVYYSHLPEEQKQEKLAACSRHRFRYIPPCTPENFWEVGFPSTQTCIERGYIKEEKKPRERLRRRRPFSALFSPKNSLDQL
ncbi:unnamed protein product [Ophioblennius macclurei]